LKEKKKKSLFEQKKVTLAEDKKKRNSCKNWHRGKILATKSSAGGPGSRGGKAKVRRPPVKGEKELWSLQEIKKRKGGPWGARCFDEGGGEV